MKRWPNQAENLLYLEYDIQQDKPGLLGAVTTLIGMLDLNILSVTGIGQTRRGLLLQAQSEAKVRALHEALIEVGAIKVTAFRPPTLSDRIALRHGKRLDMAEINPPTYRFVREDLGVLVDFLGDTLLEGGNLVIGIRGMPRVGKQKLLLQRVCTLINIGFYCLQRLFDKQYGLNYYSMSLRTVFSSLMALQVQRGVTLNIGRYYRKYYRCQRLRLSNTQMFFYEMDVWKLTLTLL